MGNFSLDLTKMNSLNIPDSLKNIAWHESNHFRGFEIYFLINLRGQDSLKTQKFVQKDREITIANYLCKI